MTEGPVRIALAIDHPAPQFRRGLQLLSAEPDVDLQVCYWSVAERFHDPGFSRQISWDVDLLHGYAWAAPPVTAAVVSRRRWIVSQLRRTRPDVVVSYGWASPIARASIAYSLLTRTPILLYGDSSWQSAGRGFRRMARSAGLQFLTRACNGAISTGAFNREFYIRHGMDPRRIWAGVCPADTESFGAARTGDEGMPSGSARPVRIGFAGKLIPRKGIDELLRAAGMLAGRRDWSVTVVGDGPLKPGLRALAAQLGVTDRVAFHGFANTTEMPKLLAGFDVVIVPSRQDLRALITIEAMAAGAAVVVSDATAVWGPGDLIEDGVTGLVYPSGDHAALAGRLARLLDDPELMASIRRHGIERSARFGPESFAHTMSRAARMCLAGPQTVRLSSCRHSRDSAKSACRAAALASYQA